MNVSKMKIIKNAIKRTDLAKISKKFPKMGKCITKLYSQSINSINKNSYKTAKRMELALFMINNKNNKRNRK